MLVTRSKLDAANRELYAKNAELAVRNKTMSLLRKLDEAAMVSLATSDMTGEIATILSNEFNYRIVGISLVEGHSLRWDAVACPASHDGICRLEPVRRPTAMSHPKNLCAKALRRGKRLVTKDLFSIFLPSYPRNDVEAFVNRYGVESALVLPLLSGKQRVGALVIGLNRGVEDLTLYERETIEGLLSLIVIAIQKAQTHESLQRTTEKLRSANQKLKELDALKTEFLSIASHQLRTPLAVTKGYVAMLEDGMVGKVNTATKGALANIHQSTESLIMLVNHLLDLSRIESGKIQVKIETMDERAAAGWVTDFIRPKAVEKGITLTYKAPAAAVTVKADPEKFKEIVMNLVDNAVKYTEKGNVSVTLGKEKKMAVLTVKDTGYGLTEKDLRHLFEKFARGSASKNVQASSGLGLYVVKKLAEAMGGSVEASSQGAGKGSTFTVRLPLAKS